MSAETVAVAHYRSRQRLAVAAAEHARRLWLRVDRANITASWRALLPELLTVLAAAQLGAAQAADDYLDEVLGAQGVDPAAGGRVAARSLAGVASDGRALETLLYEPAIATLTAIGSGHAVGRSMAMGLSSLDMMVRTQVADAGRAADQVALTSRRQATGYVRMLVGKSCSRCAILAGKRYRWNEGFRRHPRCDCIHIPARENSAEDLRTNPRRYFDSLSESEQNKQFTVAGAQAIRDGADMSQVVNARRGALGLAPAGARLSDAEVRMMRGGRERGRLQTAKAFGQDVFVTTEGVTVRGIAGKRLGAQGFTRRAGDRYRSAQAPRLMPESIYQLANGNRDEAIRLLRRFGYLTS